MRDLLQGPYSTLCTYGARSFLILDAVTGRAVFESGDEFETIVSQQVRFRLGSVSSVRPCVPSRLNSLPARARALTP